MNTFTVLADPTRAAILEALAEGRRSVNELVELSSVTQPAVSRHLRILREAGFVTSTPRGQQRIYAIAPARFRELDDWLGRFRRFWRDRLDDLDTFLDDQGDDDDR